MRIVVASSRSRAASRRAAGATVSIPSMPRVAAARSAAFAGVSTPPILEKLYLENKENDDIVFFIVHAQTNGETQEQALEFINENNYSLPFVNDVKRLTYDGFNVSVIPHIIIIDQEGTVRFTHTGYQESDNFYEKFNTYIVNLNKKRSTY